MDWAPPNPFYNQPMQHSPSLGKIFFTWLTLGIQSFGGGSSTFLLIHRACIQNGWLSEEEFVRTWALAQISPGINLLKLTVLVGHKLRGWPGLLAGMAGMLLPSGAVTVLMTAGFSAIRGQPLIQAAMKGILPATVGLSVAMAVQMGLPLFTAAHREGPPRLAAQAAVMMASALMLALAGTSPALVLLFAGLVTALSQYWIPVRAWPRPGERMPDSMRLQAGQPRHVDQAGLKDQPQREDEPVQERRPEP